MILLPSNPNPKDFVPAQSLNDQAALVLRFMRQPSRSNARCASSPKLLDPKGGSKWARTSMFAAAMHLPKGQLVFSG